MFIFELFSSSLNYNSSCYSFNVIIRKQHCFTSKAIKILLREKNDSSDYHCDNDDDENDDILDNGNNDLRT